jgi:hypothetical protein
MSRRPVTRPRQAMSARQVDRVEQEVRACLKLVEFGMACIRPGMRCTRCKLHYRLTRVLVSLRRSETR